MNTDAMENPFEVIARRLTNIEDLLLDLKHKSSTIPSIHAIGNDAPILSAEQVRNMTGWPPGTLYAKVAEMPQGIVIKGRSKRLLFDREKFVEWLKSPVEP